MKRNSTTLFLESPGSTTPLPWLGTKPDFTGIEEPALSVLQAAWEVGQENIEVIPDPIPFVQVLQPDWEGLKTSGLSGELTPMFQRLTIAAMTNNAVATAQNHIMLAILYIKDEGALVTGLSLLTNVALYSFTEEEKVAWNSKLSELNFSSSVNI